MGLTIVLVSLLMSVVSTQNVVFDISSPTPCADVGSDVDIICDKTFSSTHDELQWRRSTDDITDVQDAQKIVDTDLLEPPIIITYSGGINQSHLVPSRKGSEYILTIKDFNTTENDVYKYWCRFFQVPELTDDAVNSTKIQLRAPVESVAFIYKGVRSYHNDTIELDGHANTLTSEVNGTRPNANMLCNVSEANVILTYGELVETPYDMSIACPVTDSRRDVTVDMGGVQDVRLTCNVNAKPDTPDVVLTVTIKQPDPTTSAPPSATTTPMPPGGLSIGVITGIAIGSVICGVLVIVGVSWLVWYCFCKKKGPDTVTNDSLPDKEQGNGTKRDGTEMKGKGSHGKNK